MHLTIWSLMSIPLSSEDELLLEELPEEEEPEELLLEPLEEPLEELDPERELDDDPLR